jgi:hypothetical protein
VEYATLILRLVQVVSVYQYRKLAQFDDNIPFNEEIASIAFLKTDAPAITTTN